ncbi:MAG: DNA polymerase I [Planctomycetota bacterium]|nr:DNA polymerase I [Planctomycetota bacterium]
MASASPTLYLIDGHAQLHRAYHAIRPGSMMAADRKTPTNAVFGFAQMLRSLRTRFKPDLLASVFDPRGPVKRETLYDEYAAKLGPAFSGYKSQRDDMPDDLRPQIDLAFELCQAYGIPAIQVEGYEADDVLGTMAVEAVKHGLHVVIVTGDKDLLQLVSGAINVYDPLKDIIYDAETVLSLKGVRPEQVVDWLGLQGDASDNIPGVTGVGDQTAVKLLQKHGNLEAVLAHYQEQFADRRDEIMAFVRAHEAESAKEKDQRKAIKPPKEVKVVEAYLFAQADRARASRELARLALDAPVKLDLDALRCRPPEAPKLVPLLKRLDFRKLLSELDQESVAQVEAQTGTAPAPAHAEGTRHYTIVDDQRKLASFVQQLQRQKRFALDTETTGTDARLAELVGIAISWQPGAAFYLPVRGPSGEGILPLKSVVQALKPILEDPARAKIGHHIKYDFQVLRNCGVELQGIADDTMVAGWLLDPGALRLSLEELAYKYLGLRKTPVTALIGKGPDQRTMDLVPVQDAGLYSCGDADYTWQLARKLEPLLKEAGLEPLMRDVEVPLIEVLADMEWTGIRLDAELLRQMSKSLEEQLAAQETDIYALAGERFNINSTAQLGAILFEKLGLSPKTKTATGKDSTSEEVLSQLAREHDLPRRILEYRSLVKLKNTYVDQLPLMVNPKTGRIHASFHQTGTETGRLSSSDPNLQNIPIRSDLGRSIRAAFKPGFDGWKIVTADYSQIELRILAHYSQDAALLKAFKDGVDIHRAVAARLNNVAEKDVTREQRAQAKAVNFGIIYGQTAFGLANTLSISRQEAQKIIDAYFANHPQVRQCIDEIVARAREQGFVTTVLGRRRFVPQLRASDRAARALGERLAANTVFQGSAADLIKKAMNDIHRLLRGGTWQAKMILQIHDELLFECPPHEVEALSGLVKERMEGALPLRVPLVVDLGVGSDWLSAKD